MKTIHIDLDGTHSDSERIFAHDEILKRTDNYVPYGYSSIWTYDPSFFCFDWLSKGWDVVVYRDGKTISLTSLLRNDRTHTNKHMRIAHNVYRMLIAGAFTFT